MFEVLLMRRLMTSVLLDATNRVFERIVEESIAKAKLEGTLRYGRIWPWRTICFCKFHSTKPFIDAKTH